MMRKICVITGTRAEFGLLSGLMRLIQQSELTQLQVIATNMHLSPRYGNTYKEIEEAGFAIDYKVPIIDESENGENATLHSMARAMNGFADAYDSLQPDLVLILGDRYEMLAAATSALVKRIPIAHISGGAVSFGAFDDAIRHSITKMSLLHFTETDAYRKRVIQLGEQPERVWYVGALGVENIKRIPLLSKEEIEHDLKFEISDNTLLVTYHPVTLANSDGKEEIDAFLSALDEFPELRIIFTMPNSDNGSNIIREAIENYVAQSSARTCAYTSLGVKRYLSVMKYCAAVVGNSSSGIVETPSFHIPTLNIGSRQGGRMAAESVWHCGTDKQSIVEGLKHILSDDFRQIAAAASNPYEKEGTAENIFKVISTYPLEDITQKQFYDL